MRPTRKSPTAKPGKGNSKPPPQPRQPRKITEIAEDMIRGNPLKAVGQAAAAGYAMRFLPLRTLLMIGTQVAAPILLMAGLWKAVDALDQRGNRPGKKGK